ncbi:MAG: hypothetical protein AAGG68_10310 [Bacteroidota bacterium]
MNTKSRKELKGLFRNGEPISSNDFAELIDSTLNKRDDAFMGKWRPGVFYPEGSVVVHNQALWQVKAGGVSCSLIEPGENEDWESLIVPVQDEDWETDVEAGVMYAKVYDCVGIGQLFESEIPKATLDVEDGNGRFMILPKTMETPTLNLIKVGIEEEHFYFLQGLNEEESGFNTNVPKGFIFRHGEFVDAATEEMDFTEGHLLMVIQPDSNGLARVGISTAEPQAMLDITDRQKGQFLFNPEDKEDPVFCIANLDPSTDQNYLSTGVGKEYASLVTDAPKGFIFRHGADYEEYCAKTDLDQGMALMVVRKNEKNISQMGIGTEEPCGLIDAMDGMQGRFLVQSEAGVGPAVSILNTENQTYYATQILNNNKFTLVSDASGGYSFNIGASIEDPCADLASSAGEDVMVMLPSGNIGMGTDAPEYHLEINDESSGKFLFNLDNKKPNPTLSILNTRPDIENYLALGTDNDNSIFISNSTYGFSFRQGGEAGKNSNEVNVAQASETLFAIIPELPSEGSNTPAEVRVFPEKRQTEQPNGQLNVNAKLGVFRKPQNFELDVNGTARALSYYTLADIQKMKPQSIDDIGEVLEDLKKLRPIVFEWNESRLNLPEEEGIQYGIEEDMVAELFKGAIKVSSDPQEGNTKSIAYQSLVPILIKAIKELSEKIEDLERRLGDK